MFLIIYANFCVFALHDGDMLWLGVHDLQHRQSWGYFQVSLRMQSSLFVIYITHLAPVAHDAMKVSLAAQVMCHTVGASLNAVASEGKERCSVFLVL